VSRLFVSDRNMDRYWLLTWTTYGTWLPGDRRGFVSNVADSKGVGVRHNEPGTRCDNDIRGLNEYARDKMLHEPIYLTLRQAELLAEQFRETAGFRKWELLAVAIMRNHIHLVVGVPGDPEPETLLRDFKSYGSRRLNRTCGEQDRWWTQSGSTRKLKDGPAVISAVAYVRKQEYPLVVWINEAGERPA